MGTVQYGEAGLAGVQYSTVQYSTVQYNMEKQVWLEYKAGLGFDFPNLPFYEDSDVKLTQSVAILDTSAGNTASRPA